MNRFTFSDHAVTGITDIDEQHRELIHRFNMYADSVEDGESTETALRMLAFLVEYAAYHFGFEERMMQRYDYPDLTLHAGAHAKITQRLKEIVAEANENGALTEEVANGVYAVVDELYRSHMKEMDTPLAEYLRWHEIP